jgi:hypothetical protein
MKTKLEIICDGDSWVFGSEIISPNIDGYDYYEINDSYRVPRIFPTFLSKIMDANVTNLSYPADDNGTILNRTILYITKEYISKGKSVDNLLVIVGWSSPERNVFFYKDDDKNFSTRFRLWPQVRHFDSISQEEFWKIYVQYLWNPEEYLPRYVMNVLQLQNFCNSQNINWMCFNSFYQTPGKHVFQWEDLNVKQELSKLRSGGYQYNMSVDSPDLRKFGQFEYDELWNTIDPIRFYKKDQLDNTFYSFIKKYGENNYLHGQHPTPNSHEIWAHELHRYIEEHQIIK